MRPSCVCLLGIGLLLAPPVWAEGAAELPKKRDVFAPGTGISCASFCSQRWYEDPPSARACISECNTRTLTATMYFRGAMRGDRLDCNELLVSPSGRMTPCAPRYGLPEDDNLALPRY